MTAGNDAKGSGAASQAGAVRERIEQAEASRRELEAHIAGLYEQLLEIDPEAAVADQADPEATLRAQAADSELKYKRALADFQNYRKRALENEAEARRQGVMRVVESLLGVLDNFGLALNIDPKTSSAEQVIMGVGFIRDEMVRALEGLGLKRISPVRGEAFDALVHQAISQQATDEVKPGAIVSVASIGYALGDRVLRPARVIVRPTEGMNLEVKGAGGGTPGEACSCGPSCCGGKGAKQTEQRDADV